MKTADFRKRKYFILKIFLSGAMLGAKHGVEGIPADWMEKTKNIDNILQLAIRLSSAESI